MKMKDGKTLRLCFEPKLRVNVNHDDMFRHYAENYLSGFDIEWGGIIAADATRKVEGKFEPLYQYLIWEASEVCRNYLLEYLERNPMCGYYVHVYYGEKRIYVSK